MNKYLIRFVPTGVLGVALSSLAPLRVFAVVDPADDIPTPDPELPSTLDAILGNLESILGYVSVAFWILAIGFILYAAFLYLTAAGSDDRLKTAKKQLWYAVIAVAIALMATTIPTLIQSIFLGE